MADLQPDEMLFIPKRRRLTHSRLKDEAGKEILHLFYGEVELIFDEPDIAPVGEKLLEVEKFRADEAMSWSPAAPHAWDKVRDLLQTLIDSNILKRYTESAARTTENFPPRLGLAPEDREPHTFSGVEEARCPFMTKEAYGHAQELSNLETLVPIYRVAHPAMDSDGRQVGENNVVPRTLFLDLPTVRRTCGYPGSRYQDDLPMNVTALKNMTRRWPELLSLTQQLREALAARMPPRTPGVTTQGEMHFHVICQLASPAYCMVRGNDPVPNGQLDAGLTAVFRLIDGVRLVTSDMLRADPAGHGCDLPITAKAVYDWAERYAVFRGTWGVCAGPPQLVEEYLAVLFGDAPAPIQVEPTAAQRLGDLEAALDYGLLGQRVEAAIRYFGSAQAILHERLRVAFQGHQPRTDLQEKVEAPIDVAHYPLLRDDYPVVEQSNLEMGINRWFFGRAGEALPGKVDGAPLDELFKLDPAAQAASQRRLAEFFAHALPAGQAVKEPICAELAAVAADVFALERRCLRIVAREQGKLNERLQRKQGHPLTNVDLSAYNRPRSGPPLFETLAGGLGVTVTTDAASTVIRHGDRSLTFTD